MAVTSRVIVIAILAGSALAQETKPRSQAKHPITVTGCIQPGVECNVLRNKDGKQDYSVPKAANLQVGHAYRITGSIHTVGICMEGKPILEPEKITEVRLPCK